MATGDICGNIERLQRELRQVKYQADVNEVGLRLGDAVHFLPILHHVLLSFSRHVAQKISEQGYELQGKTDQRFVECAFKVFRDMLGLKPVLTPVQFLEQGYAERKVLLLHDVVHSCKLLHEKLAKSEKAAAPRPKRKGVCKPSKVPDCEEEEEEEEEGQLDATHVIKMIQQKAMQRFGMRPDTRPSIGNSQNVKEEIEISCNSFIILEQSQSKGSHPFDPVVSSTDSGCESPWQSNPEVELTVGSSRSTSPPRPASSEVHRQMTMKQGDWSAVHDAGQHPDAPPLDCRIFHANKTEGCIEDVNQNFTAPLTQWWNMDQNLCQTGDDVNGIISEIHCNSSQNEIPFLRSNTREIDTNIGRDNMDTHCSGEQYQDMIEKELHLDGVVGFSDPTQSDGCNNAICDSANGFVLDHSEICCYDDDEVPVARDWSHIKSVCESQEPPSSSKQESTGLVANPIPVHSSSPLDCCVPSCDIVNSNGNFGDRSEELDKIVQELSARLLKAEQEVEETRNELSAVREESTRSIENLQASVIILEGRVKFLEAGVKSATDTPMKENNHKFHGHQPASQMLKCTEEPEILLENLTQSTTSIAEKKSPPVPVLDKLKSKYARNSLSQSLLGERHNGGLSAPFKNVKQNQRQEGYAEAKDPNGSESLDTADLIARLAKRNLEAQQFLQKNRLA